MRCSVKSGNERNSCPILPTLNVMFEGGTNGRLPGITGRKEGMTSSHHGPYAQGCTRATMVGTMGSDFARRSKSFKANLSSDRRLKPACVKLESLVMADQHAAVNTFPGLVHTARHIPKVGLVRSY